MKSSQLILDPTLGQVERTQLPNSSYIQFNLTKHIQYIVTSIQYSSTFSLAIHSYIYEIYGSKYLWPYLVTK